MADDVLVEPADGVAILTMNRPLGGADANRRGGAGAEKGALRQPGPLSRLRSRASSAMPR